MPVILRRPITLIAIILTLVTVMLSANVAIPASAANGPIIISEVAPWSSGNSALAADWFEVTNTSGAAINISGWKVDDSSNSLAAALTLNGIVSIAPGESVVFIETATPATTATNFRTLWFGASPPAGLQVGSYSGAGIGLSTGGDAVNLYDSAGVLQTNVVFGGSPLAPPFATFNNAVGLSNTTISQLSVAGVNGAFAATNAPTEVGSPGTVGKLIISEVAPWSSGNSPLAADWFEVTNTSASSVNVTGWKVDDSSNSFAAALTLNGVATIAPGESVIYIETANLAAASASFKSLWFGASPPAGLQIGSYSGAGIGLSTSGDAINLYDAGGAPQANVVFGASPAGPTFPTFNNAVGLNNTTISALSVAGSGGAFLAANDANEAGSPGILGIGSVGNPPTTTVKINEVESSGGVPGDWVEFFNSAATPVDLSGYQLKDDSNTYILPAGTTISGGGYLVLAELVLAVGNFNFGLGNVDSVRLVASNGTTVVDTFAWLEHSSVTYGRCPNATGAFTTNVSSTKGAVNDCPAYLPWPGGPAVQLAGQAGFFGENMSGLVYESSGSAVPGVLWAVRNNPETLFRLVWDGTNQVWQPDLANNWSAGKQFRYTDGLGRPDSEGVTFAGDGPLGGMFVATERDNGVSNISRPAILRFDPSATGPELTATHEWNLTADLPALGSNLGLEGITWVPDTFLVSRGFFDEAAGHAYNPGDYPNHGTGLFFVGVENNGFVYGYALDLTGSAFTRVATIDSGFPGVMEIQFDRELQNFWVVCDNTCEGRTHLLRVNSGKFVVGQRYERPAGMLNYNNEGFVMAPQAECVNNLKLVYWTDDGQTDGHAIRSGTIDCDGDADDDGATNAAEIAAGGSLPNLLGSDPNDAASTPEICDGLDNDLNEGIDEGFLDTDGDGTKNCADADDDNDGTPDTNDNCPLLSGPASRGGCPNACTVALPAGYNLILGTNGNDTISGTAGNDLILAKDGNDTINGNGGDDMICAGKGNDRVVAGSGNDVIDTGEGNDSVLAGSGNNTVDSGEGNDSIAAGNGNDWVLTGEGNDDVQAGDGNNTISTADGNDKVVAGSGNDWISTGEGNDDVQAGNGNNTVSTGQGNDKVVTGSGNDVISTAEGNDKVDGGLGFDTCNAGSGNNQVSNCEA